MIYLINLKEQILIRSLNNLIMKELQKKKDIK